jgi:4-amino-4-deoxy-L-arabinose transferase-like glycosyltransferase
MRKWLFTIMAVVGVAIVAVLGVSWYALNQRVDLNSATGQAYAESFKKQFNDSCLFEAQKTTGAAATDEAMKAKFIVACTCGADAVFEQYKNEPPAKMFALTSDESERETMNRIMTTCAQQAGLQ